MSGEDIHDKQFEELLVRVDKLDEDINALRLDLKNWTQDLSEEFAEQTGILVDHFQQVIDKHLFNKPVEDYFNGDTIDSPSSAEEEEEEGERKDNNSSDDKNSPSVESMSTQMTGNVSKGQNNELDFEVD